MEGKREPRFDPDKADPSRVHFVKLDRTRRSDLLNVARELQQRRTKNNPPTNRKLIWQIAAAIMLAFILGAGTFGFSNLTYRTPHSPELELVVSFSHGGAILEPRQLTKEELAKRLPHIRAQVNVTRERAPVRLRVQVDGQKVFDQLFQAKGLSKDGPSIAVARLPISAGPHQVRVEMADTADREAWTKQWSETVSFENHRIRVVLFDTKSGFSLH